MNPSLRKLRRKMLLHAAIMFGCLCETVGCPQLFGNAFRDGTRSFLEGGLTAAILAALNLDDNLLGSLTF